MYKKRCNFKLLAYVLYILDMDKKNQIENGYQRQRLDILWSFKQKYITQMTIYVTCTRYTGLVIDYKVIFL